MDFNWKPQGINLTNNITNAGNYSLPTKDLGFGNKETVKPMGDYSFTKSADSWMPKTDFVERIRNMNTKKPNYAQNLFDAITSSNIQQAQPQIGVTGFQYQNREIPMAKMLQNANPINLANIGQNNLYNLIAGGM